MSESKRYTCPDCGRELAQVERAIGHTCKPNSRTESKFTKGPWTVEEVEPSAWVDRKTYNVVSGGVTIVGTEGLFLSEEEDRANAHLIAAAPELYEALKQVTGFYYRRGVSCQKRLIESCQCQACVDERVVAALAKAEGRS